jgi:hypothetical protein
VSGGDDRWLSIGGRQRSDCRFLPQSENEVLSGFKLMQRRWRREQAIHETQGALRDPGL